VAITLADLTGYIERDLDAELARWFPDAPRVTIAPTVRPVEPFLARLPADAARALEAFDRRVRAGTLARIWGLDITSHWSYGFDFAANEVEVLDEDGEVDITDDVWCLALDGGGNHYVVLTSGRVAVWNHEEGTIEGHTDFDNIDVFLWSMVRVAALHSRVLGYPDIEPDIDALAQRGALFLVDRERESDGLPLRGDY
jgi:hypothetical protein